MQLKYLALAGLASLATAQQSLIQALNGTSNLSNLTSLIQSQPALAASLGNLTNVTLLAPNNAAIAAFLNSSAAASVTSNQALLSAVLTYHVLNGTHSNFSTNATFIPTSLQPGMFANVTGGQRVEVMNSTVYSGLRANSSIVQQSINFTGGVIHIIDRILTVPESVSQTATAFNLTSFYGALNATNLLTAVNALSDVTVFVPNNAAFSSIGSALGNLTTAQAAAILEYHVVNGTVAYSTMLRNETVPSMTGNNLTITVRNASTIFVNNARVVIPNILVAGGVVHVIDQVLNPNSTASANGTAATGTPAFSGASSVTTAPYTQDQPTPTSSINTADIASSANAGGSSSSSGGAWMAKPTGALGAAALGGLALIMQL